MKAELAEQNEIAAAVEGMSTLNRAASEAAVASSVHALTDVTGFGLAGHLVEMLGPDGELGVELSFDSLPILSGVLKHISMGMVPGGAYRNRDAYAQQVQIDGRIPEGSGLLLFDPQTSGGLLAAVSPDNAEEFEKECTARKVTIARIGTFNDSGRVDVLP
jgi:selenide,water dikinase